MKLKTLKDLFYYCNGKLMCEADELRAEAIKQAKSLIDDIQLDWIKHFFNLTEEDLI